MRARLPACSLEGAWRYLRWDVTWSSRPFSLSFIGPNSWGRSDRDAGRMNSSTIGVRP